MRIKEIELKDYDYKLPTFRIAQYPSAERDSSKLLVYGGKGISSDIFRNILNHIPKDSLLVFNNTRVIKARIMFRKETGASIEVLCLEPISPAEYESSFSSREPVEWKCIIGNLKKWKNGHIKTSFSLNGKLNILIATRVRQEDDAWLVRFEWSSPELSFGEVIDVIGQLPLPPYVEREAETEDLVRYQTVYSQISGSVAAPTAGLHFTGKMLEQLSETGISATKITLHVGAGTFKPIKSKNIADHEMHCEHFYVTRETLELLNEYQGRIIAVGTTSVRTLESLYWLGIKLSGGPNAGNGELCLGQWDAYEADPDISPGECLEIILNYMQTRELSVLNASTKIMIIPGYKFRIINGMITNFHQPMSSLLLLVSAWVGEKWKEIYKYALENSFRFLSYGDCSLLFTNED